MKVIVLAGGLGTRLSEETEARPKALVEIGSRPILWHILKYYSCFGHREFFVAQGYKGAMIREYFLNYRLLATPEVTVDLGAGSVAVRGGHAEDWVVHLVDTGIDTMTGGRLRRLRHHVSRETFMMTYGDGVSNVDLDELVAFHRSHGKLATVTAVRPPARFGGLVIDGDAVVEFTEKPMIGEGWINGGFFVLEPGVIDYIEGDATQFELEPLARLAKDGQLCVFRHDDFWQCMDTLREVRLLERLWRSGEAPWAARFEGSSR
jgi:glucose-1-phosphate cytidylyltransferase